MCGALFALGLANMETKYVVSITYKLDNGRRNRSEYSMEDIGCHHRGRSIMTQKVRGRRNVPFLSRRTFSPLRCFCLYALWSAAPLLGSCGHWRAPSGKESPHSNSIHPGTPLEQVLPWSLQEEALRLEISNADAALRAGEEVSQRQPENSIKQAANDKEGDTSAESTSRNSDGHRENVEGGGSAERNVSATARAVAKDSSRESRDRQPTKQGVGGGDATSSYVDTGLEEGRSETAREKAAHGDADAAAHAEDSHRGNEEGGSKEVPQRTPTPTPKLRGVATSGESLGIEEIPVPAEAAVAAAESMSKQQGGQACTSTDAQTIFWRPKPEPTRALSELLVNEVEDSTEGLGLYGPLNPFFEALLSCGRKTLAQKNLTELCVQTRLERLERQPLTQTCIECFVESVVCGAEQCRSHCFMDSCAEECVQCIAERCKPGLEKCAGLGELPPICTPEDVTPSQEEDDDKIDGSRQQKAWASFFHSFTAEGDEASG